jgi:hypothetical protein
MVTVLRGTRQAGGLLRAINCLRARSPDGRSPGSPNCRSRLHPARTFATAAALRASRLHSSRPPVRPPGQQSGPYGCRHDGGLWPVCPQEKRWKAAALRARNSYRAEAAVHAPRHGGSTQQTPCRGRRSNEAEGIPARKAVACGRQFIDPRRQGDWLTGVSFRWSGRRCQSLSCRALDSLA